MKILRRWEKETLALAGITLLAFIVRIYGINFGLPYIYNADETWFVNYALAFGATRDLTLHPAAYPALLMYMLFVLYALYFALGLLVGTFHSVDDLSNLFFRDPTAFYLIGRGLVVVLATATVPLVYFVGAKLYGKRVGLVAALFMALIYNHVQFSHYIKLQVPLAFFAILSFWLIYRVYRKGGTKEYLLAGLFCGLSASVWQLGVFLVFPLLLAHLMRRLELTGKPKWAVLDRKILLGLAFVGLGFVAGSPYALLDFKKLWTDTVGLSNIYTTASTADRGWLGYVFLARETMGEALAFLALAGVLYALWRRGKEDLLLVCYPVVVLLFLSMFRDQGDYYLNPVFPFLVLFAAKLLVDVVAKIRVGPLQRNTILAVTAVAAIILPGIAIIRWDYRIAQSDTRTIAKEWVESNIPAGSRILLDSGKYYVSSFGPPLRDSRENIERRYYASTRASQGRGSEWDAGRLTQRYDSEFYRAQLAAASGLSYNLSRILHDSISQKGEIGDLADYRPQGIEYVIVSRAAYGEYYVANHPFPTKAAAYRAFYDSLDREASLLKEFPASSERSGPNIKIYKLD